jgi:hypothetical protein
MLLTQTTTVNSGDWAVLYQASQGDFRGVSLTDMLTYLETALDLGRPEPETQYAAPSASGFSVQILDDDKDVHLILTPVAGYAAGTIVLPLVSNLRDKQEITVNCTQALTALTITPNGAVAVTGAPTAFLANEFFKIKYDVVVQTWYRIG